MPLHKTEAFLLRSYALKEADKICVFLTKDQGKLRGVAHGARKIRSRFGSSLEPFTEVALSYFQKEGRELVSISSCDILRLHFERGARDVETASAFYPMKPHRFCGPDPASGFMGWSSRRWSKSRAATFAILVL
jgi:DNA repair protein RecO (recombination protein O)